MRERSLASLCYTSPKTGTLYSIALSVPWASSNILPVAYAMMESRMRTGRLSTRQGGQRMDFVAVVDQVIVLLRQRGRMTYRTLQRQFQLDDDALDDLKDETHLWPTPAVRDDAGAVLVWTGDTEPRLSLPASSSLGPAWHLPQLPPLLQRRNAASSPCCSVTWWTRRRSRQPARPGRPARGGAGLSRHLCQGDRPL